MKQQFEMLREFNKSFSLPMSDQILAFDSLDLNEFNKRAFRHSLMMEESMEYLESKDIVQVADALADQMYILIGTIMAHGLQDKFEEIFAEVHRSNMSKLENGKAIYREDGKVLKGKDYTPPDIASIIYPKSQESMREIL